MKNCSGLTFTLVFILAICMPIHSQDSARIILRSEAQQYFLKKDYSNALPHYRELLRTFPKEPEYQYCTGVCLVNLNSDPEEAIRLLRSVSLTDYNPMSLYYLGRALHLYYAFEDAIKAYSRFMLKGKSTDIEFFEVERLIVMAKNGLEFTRTGLTIKVQNTRTIQSDQLQLAAEINGSGKLIRKPAEFCSKTDNRNNYKPWMFLPAFTEINEYVYVSGYENGEKNKKQLFRIKNINHASWGFAEPLNSTINTAYDEEYPFFDTRNSTLYFSSKGHSSMGGYDIFTSVYDWNTKSWSSPENLGFPINSPYDDYVFITDEFNRSASFVSNRNTGPNRVTIYRIKLEQDTSGIHFVSVDEIRKASQLLIEPDKPSPVPAIETVEQKNQEVSSSEITNTSYTELPAVKNDYNKVLSDALILQIKADSLARITRDLRILAKEAPDDQTKKQLVTDVLKADKEAKSLQREADSKFAEARILKTGEETSTNPEDSMVHVVREINGISVYQYVSDIPEDIRDKQEIVSLKETPATDNENPEPPVLADDFAMLEKSPYHDVNPIPQGISTLPGLIYRIQLGVFSKPKPNDAFGGITPIMVEQVSGGTILKYYAGLFHSMNAVTSALEAVRTNGFPDAFIVAFFDGKLITTEKAREIEFAAFKL